MAGAAPDAPAVLVAVRADHLHFNEPSPVLLGKRLQLAAEVGVSDHFDHHWPTGPN